MVTYGSERDNQILGVKGLIHLSVANLNFISIWKQMKIEITNYLSFTNRSDGNENYDLVKQVLLASKAGKDLSVLGMKEADLQPGTLVIFCGHNSMHRVTPIEGKKSRIITVLSYEKRPDVYLNEYTRMKFCGRLK